MARSITLTLGSGLGANLGPNFNLTANVGVVTPSTATLSELLAGKIVDVDDLATQVTITSTGACTNSITQTIPCAGTTTTTSTTSTTTTPLPTTTSTTSTTTTVPGPTTTSTTTTSTTAAPITYPITITQPNGIFETLCPSSISGWVVDVYARLFYTGSDGLPAEKLVTFGPGPGTFQSPQTGFALQGTTAVVRSYVLDSSVSPFQYCNKVYQSFVSESGVDLAVSPDLVQQPSGHTNTEVFAQYTFTVTGPRTFFNYAREITPAPMTTTSTTTTTTTPLPTTTTTSTTTTTTTPLPTTTTTSTTTTTTTISGCVEYRNDTAGNINGVSIQDCAGPVINNISVPPGGSICGIFGTLSGDGGLLTLVGNC